MSTNISKKQFIKKPEYLKYFLPSNENLRKIKQLVFKYNVDSICTNAKCPNIGECWNAGTMTFLVMGNKCTRNCQFCNVTKESPDMLDEDEPENVAYAVNELNLKYVVITSVTRDDLPDGGANHFANIVDEIKQQCPETFIELLIPDFSGNTDSIDKIIKSEVNVIGHNIEMVKRLYGTIRNKSNYNTSKNVLKYLKSNSNKIIKSSLLVGLGETIEEIKETIIDLAETKIDVLIIGQYLQPSRKHYSVKKYYSLDTFNEIKQFAEKYIKHVESNPLYRSSYNANKIYLRACSIIS